MKCPVCSAELPNTAKFCGSCGTTLSAPPTPPPPSAPTYQQSPPQTPAYQPVPPGMNSSPAYGFAGTPPTAVKKKYKVLRLIAVLMKILAVVIGAISIIVGLVMIVAGATSSAKAPTAFPDTGPTALLGGLVGGLISLVYGVLVFVFLYAYAEWMYVFMDIEENTRLTNEMLSTRK
jgi:uncharacterized membrane protein